MFNLLSSQINPIIEYLNEGRDIESLYDRDIIIDEQPIIKTYEKMYADAGVYFGMKERKRLKNEDDIYRGLLYEEMIKLANSELIAQNIKVVGETSKEIIQRLLRQLIPEVIEEGAGMQQAATMLRDRIESQWHTFARFRTERIVRTEITTASNAGSLTGVKSTGIPVKKVWVATFDSNTRDPHAEANGQKVDKDDYFIVNGEQMEYPGDPAGSAGNVINCRCAMSYETV
jgi:uncharacterized protein with gpF-like domain